MSHLIHSIFSSYMHSFGSSFYRTPSQRSQYSNYRSVILSVRWFMYTFFGIKLYFFFETIDFLLTWASHLSLHRSRYTLWLEAHCIIKMGINKDVSNAVISISQCNFYYPPGRISFEPIQLVQTFFVKGNRTEFTQKRLEAEVFSTFSIFLFTHSLGNSKGRINLLSWFN